MAGDRDMMWYFLHAGPAGSPVIPVPKRPRTESSAVARVNSALFLLDTAVVSPSFVGPLAGNLQERQPQGNTNLGAEIRRAVQARLGPAADSAPAWHSSGGSSPRKQNTHSARYSSRGAAGATRSPRNTGQGHFSSRDTDACGVDVPIGFGVLPAEGRQRLAEGNPPRPRRQPPGGSTQSGSPPGVQKQSAQEAGGIGKSLRIESALQSRAGLLQLQTEAAVAKGPAAGSGAADLHLPTPLKLPVIPAAAARDRPDPAGLPEES